VSEGGAFLDDYSSLRFGGDKNGRTACDARRGKVRESFWWKNCQRVDEYAWVETREEGESENLWD